ncbi:hypothetical protein [Pseudoalteromonas nigrifaciens]|uniref:hypothetical protein n=1 Tax=Pseudoalteromonas nigrifaciens TaxID=28109 RepID=UPI003FD34516
MNNTAFELYFAPPIYLVFNLAAINGKRPLSFLARGYMKIGQQYLATQQAHSFVDVNGERIEFEQRALAIEVLPKPEMVEVDDGHTTVVEPLPDHLKCDEWFNVRNLNTGRVHWLNTLSYEVSDLSADTNG